MVERLKKGYWSPYFAGSLSGIVLILSVWLVGKFYGASTAFVRTAGLVEQLFSPEHLSQLDYFIKYVPKIDWQWMFVIGILIGAFISSKLSGTFLLKAAPDMWQRQFGPNRLKRGITAFVGGVIAIFGARLAGGCPSGHGVSGSIQLSVSSFIAVICFFIGGIVTAKILYREDKST